jgi:hypothetical protein
VESTRWSWSWLAKWRRRWVSLEPTLKLWVWRAAVASVGAAAVVTRQLLALTSSRNPRPLTPSFVTHHRLRLKQLYLPLHSSTGTYQEHGGVTMDTVMHTMHAKLQNMATPIRKIKGYQTLFRTLDNYHQCCLKESKLCPFEAAVLGSQTRHPNQCHINNRYHKQSDFYCFALPARTKGFFKSSRPKRFTYLDKKIEWDEVRFSANHSLRFATFDVTAPYPSIDLERCLNSMT